MRMIKLKPDAPFYNNVDIKVVDVTDGKEKVRATIQLEYAKVDIEPFINQGLSLEEMVERYHERMYHVIRHYLSGDFQVVEGLEEVLGIVREHVARHLQV